MLKPARLKTIIINWHGPFCSIEEITNEQEGNGLYLIWGKKKGQKLSRFQYIGITERNFCERFKDKDHKINTIRFPESSIWLGYVHYPNKFDRSHLELAEHCIAHFVLPGQNSQKLYQPRKPVCIISQWCKKDGFPRFKRPSLPDYMPDMLWWDLTRWRTGNMKVWSEE